MSENKNLPRALGILFAIVILTLGVFLGVRYINAPLSIEAEPLGVHIVAQSPMDGQRLNLSDSISLTFDRDMDSALTGDSFALLADGEEITGRGVWSDARTFAFTPDAPLQPATSYTARFTTQARALDGESPKENIAIEFVTIEALAVAQTFPANDSFDVDYGSSITVIFNHPVVPLSIKEDQSKLPQPLNFSPEVKGSGEWVNSSMYVFEPEEGLRSGTMYQVTISAGLTDTLGNALADSFQWGFSTRYPIVQNFGLKDGAQNPSEEVKDVPLDQIFTVGFEQPMDAPSVEAATRIINRETKQPAQVKFEWNESSTELVITPLKNFSLANFYNLIIDQTAQAKDGGQLGRSLDMPFATAAFPAITSVYPEAGADLAIRTYGISITFASQMDVESLKGKVQISPAVNLDNNFYYNIYDRTLYINELAPATRYVVRLLPGMKDVYGNAIKDEMSYSFYNGDYQPYANLAMPWTPLVYRAQGTQEVYFDHRNIEQASVAIYPIDIKTFKRLSSGDLAPANFNPKTNPVREWNITAGERNVTRREHFLFDENGQKLEPGYYFIGMKGAPLSNGGGAYFYQASLFTVATDNVTFKATSTEGLAWVTDLETGKPQANVPVTFYDNELKEIGRTTTDKDGVAYVPNIKSANYVEANGGGRFGFTALYWGSEITAGNFGIYENYFGGETKTFSYVYTDRPIYRPDQEVFFKGILRENDDLRYSLSKLKQVYVVVGQWGENIFSEYVPVNEQGSFSGAIKLDKDVSLGAYDIYVYPTNAQDTASIGYVSFNVAEYKKPEFEVTALADKDGIRAGDVVNFGLDSTYYSGGKLKGAQVNWYVETDNFYFTPSEKYNRYSFMDWDREIYWYASYEPARAIVAEGEGVTDENGHLDISQALDLGKDKASKSATLYANVSDVAGNQVSGNTRVVIHQSDYYAGITSDRYVGAAGEAQPFSIAVLDWDSNPVAGQKVSVEFLERQWFSVQKKNEQGVLQWETSVKETVVEKQEVTTGADGIAQVSFVPPTGGVFKALVTVSDARGNTHQASTYLWVWSNQAISWRQSNDRSFNIIADKDMYAPGDTAEVLIAQPFDHDVYALVTYERGHIYKQEVVLLKGSSTVYKLPITDEMAPVSYVSVTVISGAEKTNMPDFKIGMTKINVDTKQKTIDVKINADKKSAGPGDEVTYTIETKDITGKPVSADVSLAVVDKAVLALAPPNSAPMLSSFYSQQALSVVTALGIVASADQFNEEYRKTSPDGSGGGGGGGGDLGIITVRENFKDTAAFKAEVTTDENGLAQVKVTLPENLTTWQADVRAVTADSRVGEATHELTSAKPLYVQLQTPRFFVVGDEVTLGATVFNNSSKPLKVNVTLDAQGVELKSDKLQAVEVPAKQQAYVTWDVVVNDDSTRVDLTATAASGEFTDASKPALGTLSEHGLPVYNFTVPETVGTSGMITSANSVTENIQLPASVDFTDATLSVELAPSLAASMVSGLTYLEDYPYLCMEQTVSRFLPNVIAARALKEAGIESPAQENLDANVNAALQRIYAKQLFDGGWNWWDGSESDPQTSAYVVYGLIEAKESGYEVSQTVLDNGIAYLKNNIIFAVGKADGLAALSAGGGGGNGQINTLYNRYAFMMYVLARADKLDAGKSNALFAERQYLSLYGEAYLAQAMFMLDPEDSRIDTLMSDLTSAAAMSSSGVHWEEDFKDYWNWNSDTRTTAIVLNAFTQIEPTSPLTANAVRWLMSNRERGHWYSTQETSWSLIALTNWLVASKEFDTDYKYAIGLNGNMLENGKATKDELTQTVELQVQLKDLLKESNALVFARGDGTGNLYYSAYLTATLPVEQVQPLDQGVSVSREYFALDDSKTPITEIARGELVKVRLTLVVPASVHYIVIDDPLPAGLEAVNQSLLTDTAVPMIYTAQDYKERGWGWWFFRNVDIHDEKVSISSDYLPAGSYTYTYIARASSAGTFKVIPPTASEFYFPDVAGRGAGSLFTVK